MFEYIPNNTILTLLPDINRAVSVMHPTTNGNMMKWGGCIQKVVLCENRIDGGHFLSFKGVFTAENGYCGPKTILEPLALNWVDTTLDVPISDIRVWLGIPALDSEPPHQPLAKNRLFDKLKALLAKKKG
jgi:hypothetical protein